MTTKTHEPFDCLAYKNQVQQDIHEHIKDFVPHEQVEWFRAQVQQGPFAAWWNSLAPASPPPAAPVSQAPAD